MKMKKVCLVVTLFILTCCICIQALAGNISLPSGLIKIEEEAFQGDSSLTEVTVPEGVVYIGPRAFADSSLKKINLPDSLLQIENGAFDEDVIGYGSPNNKRIKEYFLSRDMVYNDGTGFFSRIDDFEFRSLDDYRCELVAYTGSDLNITIPYMDGTGRYVTRIGDRAFEKNFTAVTITMYSTVTEIGEGAFAYCTGLSSISLSPDLTSIHPSAFYGDNGLLIYGYYDSLAHTFAQDHNIPFSAYDAPLEDTLSYSIDAPASTQIRLIFNRVNGATEYRIYQSLYSYQASVKSPRIFPIDPSNEGNPSVFLSECEPGKTYHIWVSAVVNGVEQAPVYANIKMPTGGMPGETARLYALCWTTDSVTLQWYHTYGTDYYLVLVRKAGESLWYPVNTAVKATTVWTMETLPTFTVSGLEEDTAYEFAIQSYDRMKRAGNISTSIARTTFKERTGYLHTDELPTYPDSESDHKNGVVNQDDPVTLLGESPRRYYFEMTLSGGGTAKRWAEKTYIVNFPFQNWYGYLNQPSAPTYANATSTYENGTVRGKDPIEIVGVQGTRYCARIKLSSGSKVKRWVDQEFIVRPKQLPAPTFITPAAENGLIDRSQAEITWKPVTGASCYYLTLIDRDSKKTIIKNKDVGLDTSYTLTEKELSGVRYTVRIACGEEHVPADSTLLKWNERSFTTESADFTWEILSDLAFRGKTIDIVVRAPENVTSVSISGTYQELGYSKPAYSIFRANSWARESDGTFVIHMKNESQDSSMFWLEKLHFRNEKKEEVATEDLNQYVHFLETTGISLRRCFNTSGSATVYAIGKLTNPVGIINAGQIVYAYLEANSSDDVSYISWQDDQGVRRSGFVYGQVHRHENQTYYDANLQQHTYCVFCEPRTEEQILEDANNNIRYATNTLNSHGTQLFSLYDSAGLYLKLLRETNENFLYQFGAYAYNIGTINIPEVLKKQIEGSDNVNALKKESVLKALELLIAFRKYDTSGLDGFDEVFTFEMEMGNVVADFISDVVDNDAFKEIFTGDVKANFFDALEALKNALKSGNNIQGAWNSLVNAVPKVPEAAIDKFLLHAKDINDKIKGGVKYGMQMVSFVIDSAIDIAEYNAMSEERKKLAIMCFYMKEQNIELLETIRNTFPEEEIKEQCDVLLNKLRSTDNIAELMNSVKNVDSTDVKEWLKLLVYNGGINLFKLAESVVSSAFLEVALGSVGGLVTAIPKILGFIVECVTHTGKGYAAFEDIDVLHTHLEEFTGNYGTAVNSSGTRKEVRVFAQLYVAEMKIAGLELSKDIVTDSAALKNINSWQSELDSLASDMLLVLGDAM